MTDDVSLSIEETNKLRISLGLKPLDSGKSKSKDEVAVENFKKLKEEEEANARKQDLLKRIERSKNKRDEMSLSGKGLGDLDEMEVDDPYAWVEKSREKQKNIEQQLEKNKKLDLKKQRKNQPKYSSENLEGLKVVHDLSEIQLGEEEILILKDQSISQLEELGDELQSERLAEKIRLENNAKLKRQLKEHGTFGMAYDDLASGINFVDRSYLNEDLENETKFQLGAGGVISAGSFGGQDKHMGANENKGILMNAFSIQKSKSSSQSNGSSRIKKNKNVSKVKAVAGRRKRDDELVGGWGVDEEKTNELNKQAQFKEFYEKTSTQSFVDDYELQELISKARKTKVEYNLALSAIEEAPNSENIDKDDDRYGSGGLLLSSTTEFVEKVGSVADAIPQPETKSRSESKKAKENQMGENSNDISEANTVEMGEASLVNEVSDEEMDGNDEYPESVTDSKSTDDTKNADLDKDADEEPLVGKGIASALKLLMNKGIVRTKTEEEIQREKDNNQKQQWLIDSKKRELIRTIEQDKAKMIRKQEYLDSRKGSKKSRLSSGAGSERKSGVPEKEMKRLHDSERAEREYLREQEELMKNYKPSFKLEYRDEDGRELTPKEAFKDFAHQFHGKFPGKKKADKAQARIQREKETELLNSTERTVKMGQVWENSRKKQSSAHVVLTVGNKTGLGNASLQKK
ncbi:hypothetical protein BB559_006571 [Furculomyces boomerangus]|uniref:SART-1 protein n=2 Tax=Harpellales TaxID=61421 RepID=A0A2T9Y1T0_9FUNG|nr:hypothetical protein BB559_006571 [Furculomyces boomerangus]PVZ98811.1 hypothetical protein BB558_005184 [Smittium angustum]